MAGSNPWWWADASVDWTRPEPVKVRDILKSAYPATEAVLALAAQAGLPSREASGTNAGDDAWTWAINTAVAIAELCRKEGIAQVAKRSARTCQAIGINA